LAKKPVGPVRRDFAPWEDPAARPFIEFRNVTKTFGDFTAVDDLSLKIHEREFFALLGGSGCGKTTMMRMLAGFETPNAGEILLDGQNLAGVPPYRRPVNMMFQSYALFPHMSVEANVAFGLRQEGMPRTDIALRVSEMLKLVRLEHFAKRKPHQLSGGQRQRVALARSLAKKPKVLLLDEPLGALDRKLREDTQFELMDLQYELGMTFLIVTHDQEEAMTVADRIAVIDRGRLMQYAAPETLYREPANDMVAAFIGNGLVLPADDIATLGSGRATASIFGIRQTLRCARTQAARASGTVNVHPADLALAETTDDGFAATVERVIFRGGHKQIEFHADASPDLALTLNAPTDRSLAPGDRISVRIEDGWVIPARA